MNWLSGALLALPLATMLVACGGGTRTAAPSKRTAASAALVSKEGTRYLGDDSDDNLQGWSVYDRDDLYIVEYGKKASSVDMHEMAVVVGRYFADAVAADGAKACGLIYSKFAEAIPEDYGTSPPGPPGLRGKTCAEVMRKFFIQKHHVLVQEERKLDVAGARTERLSGIALLGGGPPPIRHYLEMHLEHGRWKVDAMMDPELQ